MRITTTLAIVLICSAPCAPNAFGGENGSASNLVSQMGQLQYFTHKLGLSVSAKNQALQGFYVHEVEEVVEELTEVEDFDGIPIGELVKTILVPTLHKLEHAVKAKDAAAADTAFDEMLNACNTCHQNANRPYLQIKRLEDNPYFQSFDPMR